MKQHFSARLPALLLALVLLLPACGGGTTAATIHLKHTEGTVGVTDSGGKDIAPREDLGLYSGYGMDTQPVSYAWINLDDVKLVKMDENSDISIEQDGKKLAVQVNQGSLFFNITQPLAEDETLDIRTSSMTLGIRGTCGWVNAQDKDLAQVYILEGTVSVTAGEETVSVTAGEMAQAVGGAVTVTSFPAGAVPAFVQVELEQDEALAADILEASGLDVLSPVPDAEAVRAEYENVLAEWRTLPDIDFVMGTWDQMDWSVYRYVSDQLFFFDRNNAFYAFHDVNGDGTEELLLSRSYSWGGTTSYSFTALYTFDGAQAVCLFTNADEGGYDILADGVIYTFGNGGAVDALYRIPAGGASLEEADVPDVAVYDPSRDNFMEAMIEAQDFSPHGGPLADVLDWTAII